MNTKGLNKYLKNYLINDKTQRAVMLTGPWGSGKSYYIKHELCPFLLENKLDYAVVSVYGIKELKDINKSLYLEIRTKNLKTIKFVDKASKKIAKNNSEEVKSSGKIIGKTVVKGIASFFNVNLDLSDRDLEKLYASVNLKGKLIIFEDVERSGIDLIEFLGYVNNIVETDGIKVLLVTNESELIKYEKAEDNKKSDYTEETKRYLRIKEKTVGDTIQFYSDPYDTIQSIYKLFKQKWFDNLLTEKNSIGESCLFEKIESIMREFACYNYRSLLFGLQKAYDIFMRLDAHNYDLAFLEHVMLGIIAFSIKNKLNDDVRWTETSYTSSDLGCSKYPIDKFAFDYIKFQYFDINDVNFAQQLFLKGKERVKNDGYLNTIYNYYVSSEKEVKQAIDSVYELLKEKGGLPVSVYVQLANYLISLRTVLNYNTKISSCLKLMLKNSAEAAEKGEKINTYASSGITLESEKEISEFENFKAQLSNLSKVGTHLFNFDYTIEHLDEFCDSCMKTLKDTRFIDGFAVRLDIDKFFKLIVQCSSAQLYELRGVFLAVYDISNVREFYQKDKNNLEKLKNALDNFIKNNKKLDAIKRKQLEWFVGNLQSIIEDLSGGKDGI